MRRNPPSEEEENYSQTGIMFKIFNQHIAAIMGQNSSTNLQEFKKNYKKLTNQHDDYLGSHEILQHRYSHDQIIHKIIHLSSNAEVQEFNQAYKAQTKTAFHVIYPFSVYEQEGEGLCSKNEKVHVFFKNKYPTLKTKLNYELGRTGKRMKESQIWFILNELSRSLQILHENNHPHIWIHPTTIYFNKNQNWFLYDTYYLKGANFQDFLRQKLNKHKLASQSLRLSLHNHYVDLETLQQEDIYCLGYVILYLMTNFYPENCLTNLEILNLVNSCLSFYSKKLIRITQNLIEENKSKRMSLKSLRERLKSEEKNIILEEQSEYKRQNQYNRQRFMTDYKTVRAENALSPPVYPLTTQNYESKRDFYRSPPTQNRQRYFQSPNHQFNKKIRGFEFTSPKK